MGKITEAAKGLKAAACELHNNEYIKGYNHSCVTTVATYISNKQ